MGNKSAKQFQQVVEDMKQRKAGSFENFRKLFAKYDTDKSNSLEGEEVKRFLKDLFQALFVATQIVEDDIQKREEEFIKLMIQTADKNNDGVLQYEEIESSLTEGLESYAKQLISM